MISLPISLCVALLLGFLLVRLRHEDGRFSPLSWLLGICIVQSLIIALALHYGVSWARDIQPVSATLIPPVAWLAFRVSAIRPLTLRDAVHGIGPALALGARFWLPAALDALIPGLFVLYGAAILLRCLRGPDALPRLRLDGGRQPGRLWIVIALSLWFSALGDVLLVAAAMVGMGHLQPVFVSFYAAANLLVIGFLVASPVLKTEAEASTADAPQIDHGADRDAMARLETLMQSEKLYLDPDLTLMKLARRTGIPAKSLSTAINRVTGQSVSRYVNDRRIAAAQEALIAGTSVTQAMLNAGFNTKSNFNREFLRVTGKSPTEWLKAQARA